MEKPDLSKMNLSKFKWSDWMECPYQSLVNKRNRLNAEMRQILTDNHLTKYELFVSNEKLPRLNEIFEELRNVEDAIAHEQKILTTKFMAMKEDPEYKDIFTVWEYIAEGMSRSIEEREKKEQDEKTKNDRNGSSQET